jgi:RNA polymerase sigma-70 factor (ECF subfamily)
MSEPNPFANFMQRIRAGDQEAAAELVRQYEPAIRLEVRLHLFEPELQRAFDSMDVCQSVLASFFVRAAAGQFDIERPEDLMTVLVVMAQRKLVSRVRKERAQRRDQRRREPLEGNDLCAADPSPGSWLVYKDLLQAVRAGLSPDERQLADLRGAGYSWPEIAERLGGTAVQRRKQLGRALDRVSAELGLDEIETE